MKKIIALSILLMLLNSCFSKLSDEELKENYQQAFEKKNWIESLTYVNEGIRRKPTDTILYFSRALCLGYIDSSKYNEQINKDLDVYLGKYPTSSRGRFLKYSNLFGSGHYDKAIDEVKEIEKSFGISFNTLLMRANAQFLSAKYKEAAFNYEEALCYPISTENAKFIYYHQIYAKYFSGNIEGALWDTAFLEKRGFKEDDELLKLIDTEKLDIKNYSVIPFRVELNDFAKAIRPTLGLAFDNIYRPIYSQKLYQTEKNTLKDLKYLNINIEFLNLNNAGITIVPDLSKFKNLKALDLSSNHIRDFDKLFKQLAKLEKLEYLDLDYSNLKNFPASIAELNKLKGLSIAASNIRELPPEIAYLSNLSFLSVRNNGRLKDLPKEIKYLKNLNVLDVSGSGMQRLREEVALCYELIAIKANAAQIKSLPENIDDLKLLVFFGVSYNKIKNIPESIGNMPYLGNLSLGSNEIEKLPSTIANLNNLKSLSLEYNRFKEFPDVVLKLNNLESLWLHNNSIPEIPLEIAKMPRLKQLLVDHEVISDENIKEIEAENSIIKIEKHDTRSNVRGAKRKG